MLEAMGELQIRRDPHADKHAGRTRASRYHLRAEPTAAAMSAPDYSASQLDRFGGQS